MTICDLEFPISAMRPIPANGYELMSGLARLVPAIHDEPRIGIHPLRGARVAPGRLRLEPSTALTIRTPADLLPTLVALAGKRFLVGDASARLGCPRVLPLRPYPTLSSRLVTIKGYLEAAAFRVGLERQIDRLELGHKPEVAVGARRVLRIKGMTIVGFAVVLGGLTDEDSLALQGSGLGGRRRFGCGVFVPTRTAASIPAGEPHAH